MNSRPAPALPAKERLPSLTDHPRALRGTTFATSITQHELILVLRAVSIACAFVVSQIDDLLRQERKASDFPACRNLLDPKNPPIDLHGHGCHCVRDRRERNSELNIGTRWGRSSSKHERASFTNVTTSSFSLVLMAVCVLPSEKDRRLHGITHRFPRRPFGAPHDSPPAGSVRASRLARSTMILVLWISEQRKLRRRTGLHKSPKVHLC